MDYDFLIVNGNAYWRLGLAEEQERLFQVLEAKAYLLIDDAHVVSCMADTNTTDWQADIVEILDSKCDGMFIIAKFAFTVHGEADEDKPFCGDTFKGTAVFKLMYDGTFDFADVTGDIDDSYTK